jgi:hypothetical protein
MKKITFALFLVLASFHSFAFEKIDLPNNRTSMEYGPQVRSFINNIEHYKWEAENGEAFHFVQATRPYEDEFVNQNIYLTVKSYFYGSQTSERLMYVVQSKYVGFLDLIDHETSQIIPIRYLSDERIETFDWSDEVTNFTKVEKWSENPKPVKEIETAEEKGLIW